MKTTLEIGFTLFFSNKFRSLETLLKFIYGFLVPTQADEKKAFCIPNAAFRASEERDSFSHIFKRTN